MEVYRAHRVWRGGVADHPSRLGTVAVLVWTFHAEHHGIASKTVIGEWELFYSIPAGDERLPYPGCHGETYKPRRLWG